jgi:Family of unknown function (DUF6069)
MTSNPYHGPSQYEPPPARPRPQVDMGRLRAGALATAIVAALLAIVGILLVRGVFKVPVLAPTASGVWGNAGTFTYAVAAALFGLLATALMFLLLRTTPTPFNYFSWIIGLITAVAVVMPFTLGSELSAKVATAVINAIIGFAVGQLTVSAARRSIVYSSRNNQTSSEPEGPQPPFR